MESRSRISSLKEDVDAPPMGADVRRLTMGPWRLIQVPMLEYEARVRGRRRN